MAKIRSQVVLQGATMLPEDRFINTFHFDSAGEFGTQALVVGGHLASFYGATESTTPNDGAGVWISQFVKRAFTIRHYDMDLPPDSRVPVVVPWTLPAYATDTIGELPEEVAVCLSFRGAAPVTPSRRGRIYLGPLKATPRVDATAALPTRVEPALRSALCTWAQRLLTAAPGWCIYSPTTNAWVPVTGGHVDDAFDIQRRRGPKATVRTLWGSSLA